MKILRVTDIITLKSGNGVEVDFSPLRYDRSLELASLNKINAGNTVVDLARETALLVKYAVKELRGLTDYDDQPIVIKSVNGELSEDDVSTCITALSKTPYLAAIGYISTSSIPKKVKGVDILVNGKVIDLGKD
jgi:hypothetical protein